MFMIAGLAPATLPGQDRIELGYQTTKRGIVWYRPGMPTHNPAWQLSRDTNAVLWHDTLTAIRYDWDYSDDVWRAKGLFSGPTPPLPRQVSGSTMVDNRTASWIRDTFNLLHKYDSTANAWTPTGDFFYLSNPPTDIANGVSNGPAKYRRSLWQDSDDNVVYYFDGAAWTPLGAGTADGSETIVTGTNGITVTGTGTSGSPYVVGMPAGTSAQTLRHNGTAWTASSMLTNDGLGIGINSAPNASFRAFLKQSTTTDGLAIQRSSATGQIELYHDAAGTLRTTANNLDIRSAGQLNLYGAGGGSFISQIFLSAQANITSTFGNSGLLRFSGTYAPSISGGDFAFMKFLPSINQTGSADQDVFLIDFNPTLTSVLGQLYGIRYFPSSGRFLWQPNGAGTVINHLAGNTGIGSGSDTPAQTLHVQGTARITGSDGTATTVVGRDGDGDISALALSGLTISAGTLTVTADGDGSATNEAWTIDADDADTELISNQTVKFQGAGIASTDYNPTTDVLLITATEVDGSTTNEVQTYGHSGTTSYTNTLSLSGGSFTIQAGTNVSISHSGGTVTISATAGSADGNGIYGDGTPGSGDDALPSGGTSVTIPNANSPLSFLVDAASGNFYAIKVITDYCSDETVTNYFVGKSTIDSFFIKGYDCGTVLDEIGGQLTVSTDREMILVADSIQATTLPAKTTLRYITGLTQQDYLAKIQGSTNGQILKWNSASGGYWELGTDNAGGSGTVTGTGTANRLAYWTSSTNIAADDDAFFDGASAGFGTTTMTGKVNIDAGTTFAPIALNAYGTASSAGGVVYAQLSNLLNTSTTVLSLNQDATLSTVRAGLRKYGTAHATRPNELEVFTSVASAPVTLSTNSTVRLTAAADGTVHATNKLAGGFSSTTGIHSTLQSGGSLATAYLETVGAPTFDDTKRTVVYTASTNISWTLPSAATCNCPGREYILHHAGTAGTITLSQSISKGNGTNFNTLTAGQWARIVYGTSGGNIRGFKITSL